MKYIVMPATALRLCVFCSRRRRWVRSDDESVVNGGCDQPHDEAFVIILQAMASLHNVYCRVEAKRKKSSIDVTVFAPNRLTILESDRAVLHKASTLDAAYSHEGLQVSASSTETGAANAFKIHQPRCV